MALYHTVNGSPVGVNNILIGGAETQETVTGNNTLSLPDAKVNSLTSVVLDGATEQSGTPSPNAPMDIVCNNGVLKLSPNLFDKNLVPDVNEYINKNNGNVSSPTSGEFRHSDYIVIKENTQYYVGIITSTASTEGLAFYDDTKTLISGISLTELGNNNNIITSPANTKYIRFSFRTDEGYNTNWQNTVYFVEGNQPLVPYMPYGEIYTDGTQEVVTDSLSNTATAQRLLKVGTYKDTQELISGSVTRNVEIKVLDGTEDWTESGTIGDNAHRFSITINTTTDATSSLCTHISRIIQNNTTSQNDRPCIRFTVTGSGIQVYTTDNTTTLTQWTQFLATQYANGTPVIVVYPLATAATESVTGQTLTVQQGANTLTATGSTSTLGLSATYTKGTQLKPNYVIRNDKLVWAKPNMYLTGPNTYTVVGSPTIVDGVASGFSGSDCLSVSGFPMATSDWEIVIKAQTDIISQTQQRALFGGSMFLRVISGVWNLALPSGTEKWGESISTYPFAKITKTGSYVSLYFSADGISYILKENNLDIGSTQDNKTLNLGGGANTSIYWLGSIDLNQTYIKVNDQLWFYGKNYATQNIAPVPSGYTYGTTTTSAIGFVDMRTQAFTAAPSGATIGRDE